MKDVGLRLLAVPVVVPCQIHSGKSGIPKVIVVASFEAGERGNGVDAHCPQIVRTRLKEWKNVGMELNNLRQKIGVAGLSKLCAFLFARETRKVINLFAVDSRDVAAGGRRQRSLGEELGPGQTAHAGHKAIFAEGFAIEKTAGAQL